MSDLDLILREIDDDSANQIAALRDELADTWTKRQIFRTETEARVSVLNDGKHPTPAAKYWQAVREQAVMLHELMMLSFELRRNAVQTQKLGRKLAKATDELKQASIQIDLDEAEYTRANMLQIAKDRCREVLMWSELKAELNDGSFDARDVNLHQSESLPLRFQRKVETLGPAASADETFNAVSQLRTAERLAAEGRLPVAASLK